MSPKQGCAPDTYEEFSVFPLEGIWDLDEESKKKKPHQLLGKVKFVAIEDGLCVQLLHEGSYDSEPASFLKMMEFADKKNLHRISHSHREIYLSDARKVTADKLKTVLRVMVE